jgi:pullulanase/glycogen debranching enzyme
MDVSASAPLSPFVGSVMPTTVADTGAKPAQLAGLIPPAAVGRGVLDGAFTLTDLVFYNAKHNEAHGENNNDGEPNNRSRNGGAEGPTSDSKALMVYLNGAAIPEPDASGRHITDDSFVLCCNAHWEPVEFQLPDQFSAGGWTVVLDTVHPRGDPAAAKVGTHAVSVQARSLLVVTPHGGD